MMAAHDPGRRLGRHLLLTLTLITPCMTIGCGGEGSAQPAPVDAAQAKKAQQYMQDYRQQIRADNEAKAKAKAGGKKSH
jgi:hypothetical protein